MRTAARAIGLCLALGLGPARDLDAQRAGGPARDTAARAPAPPVIVDRAGVMRWAADGREVALFGVNYAAPFAYDFQALTRLGVDPKRAIDQDVAHLARLGVDAYRIHVWDREVSDREGNLLANAHLDLLDYLIARLSARGIKSLLTPIAWWGPGYPAPDHPSPGFSNGYTKPQMAVDTAARRAQARYVAQFVAHVNPYTGRSYRDDPDIIAFEVFNEPWHDLSPPRETTRYINTLVASMRNTGLRKPIFYNISEHFTPEQGHAVCAADIQGVSAQWYPTGLVRGAALPGNPLPNVDRYPLPWADFAGCRDKARMVYEFDAADVAEPVMYPAMARAFRGAGFQWATQFAYDPLAIAHTNTEYQTHYLNLVYTPAKAVSFLIAGEAFRRLPRGFDAGTYPASERFGAVRTSWADRVSELVTDTLFAYSGSTRTTPPAPAALRHVVGVGSSPVVGYGGSGAYFLDRLADGVWRLEVYPDAVPVEEPYSRGSLRRTVTRIIRQFNVMVVTLPDLGGDFTLRALDAGNAHASEVSEGTFGVRPGAYLLTRRGVASAALTPDTVIGGRRLGEFHAPPSTGGPTVVRHEPPSSIRGGGTTQLTFDVVQDMPPDSVLAFVRFAGWQGYLRPIRLRGFASHRYLGELALDTTRTGPLEYAITVFSGATATTYPGAVEGLPTQWDFTGTAHWTSRVEPRDAPLVLFDADRDRARVVGTGHVPGAQPRSDWVAGSGAERAAWLVGADRFGPTARHVAARTMLRDGSATLIADAWARAGRTDRVVPVWQVEPLLPVAAEAAARWASEAMLRVRLRADGTEEVPVEVALVTADGAAWGTTIRATAEWRDVEIPVRALARVPLVLLPRPYPTFLPYDLTAAVSASAPDLTGVEGIQWGFARAAGTADDAPMRALVERVELLLPVRR